MAGDRTHNSIRLAATRSGARAGFTLLEVILALALAVLVMMLIGMAIDTHVTLATTGREEIEEAQLARALLRQISEDLHSTVLYSPQDMSGMTSLMSGLEGVADSLPDDVKDAANAATGGALGGSGQGTNTAGTGGQASSGTQGGASSGSQTGANATSGSSSATGATTDDAAATEETSTVSIPGLYGDATQLQIDVSRLPRLDEYQSMVQGGAGQQHVPSDVKTVTYYLGDTASANSSAPGEQTATGGLVRQSLDRAVSEFAYSNGGVDQATESEGMIAPQVTDLTFAYFDGTAWTDTWDSELNEGLPLAVEVTLVITARPPRSLMARAGEALSMTDSSPVRETVYRQVIHLPAAQPIPDATAMEEEPSSESETPPEPMQ